MNKDKKGTIGELKAQIYFIDQGYDIYAPVGGKGIIDFLAVKDDEILKIQCKNVGLNYKHLDRYYEIDLYRKIKDGRIFYKEESFDYFWISTPDGDFLIPSKIVFEGKENKLHFRIYPRHKKYNILGLGTGPQAEEKENV
jgi:hypothetical protein